MKKRTIKIVSWFMLAVFLVGTLPKEYLHGMLYHHQDTVHPGYKKGEIVITRGHIHCSFLGFVFAPFIVTEQRFFSVKEKTVRAARYVLPFYVFHSSAAHKIISLRGPPVFC